MSMLFYYFHGESLNVLLWLFLEVSRYASFFLKYNNVIFLIAPLTVLGHVQKSLKTSSRIADSTTSLKYVADYSVSNNQIDLIGKLPENNRFFYAPFFNILIGTKQIFKIESTFQGTLIYSIKGTNYALRKKCFQSAAGPTEWLQISILQS